MYSNREQSPTGQQNEMTPMDEVVAFLCVCILTNYYEVLFKIAELGIPVWLVCMETGKIVTQCCNGAWSVIIQPILYTSEEACED